MVSRKKIKGGEKCPSVKPISIKKNKNKEYIRCLADSNDTSDLSKELIHAYDVESKKEDEDDDSADCFCTNFDFVWITNINEAKRRLINADKELTNSQVTEVSPEDVKTVLSNVEPFDIIGFMHTYIEIAKKKWSNGKNENTEKIISELEKTKTILANVYNENKEEIDNYSDQFKAFTNDTEKIKEAIEFMSDDKNNNKGKEVIADNLPAIIKMFDIGKYIILEERQIDDAALRTILDNLTIINEIFEPTKKGGRKRKTKNMKRYKRKQTRKKYRGGGKRGAFFLFSVILIIVGACLAPVSAGASTALIVIGILGVLGTPFTMKK